MVWHTVSASKTRVDVGVYEPFLEFLSKLWFLRNKFIIENQKTLIWKKESTSGNDTDFLCSGQYRLRHNYIY